VVTRPLCAAVPVAAMSLLIGGAALAFSPSAQAAPTAAASPSHCHTRSCPAPSPSPSSSSPSASPTSTSPTPAPSTSSPDPSPSPSDKNAVREHIITALYAWPTLSSWGQVESAAPTVSASIVDICAPDGSGSGCNGQPADAQAPVWLPTIAALETAGVTPLYYIATGYDQTPLATIEGEMQDAVNWYGLSNFFFDEESTNDQSYYKALYNYAIGLGAVQVVFNPGTMIPQSYMSFGRDEVQLVFEGTQSGFRSASFPSWLTDYPASEYYAALSVGTSAGVGTDISDAVADGIGNIYVDDEAEPPSYSTLPAFWSTEISDVAAAP